MSACPSCGHGNQAGAKFCSECGAALVAAEPLAREERKVVTVLFAAAQALLDEAEVIVSPTSWAAQQAQILLARTEVDRLAGAPEQAAASLRAALRIYQDRHAAPLADQAAAALAGLAAHPSGKPA